MDVLLVNLEIAGLSTVLVGLYALRRWLGLAPLYIAVGLLLCFMMLGGRLEIDVPVPGGRMMNYTSLAHLTLVMASVVLIYALEGTSEARRMVAGIALVNLLLFVLRLLLAQNILNSGVDLQAFGRFKWVDPTLWGAVVSTTSLAVAGVTIIVVYQALYNLSQKIPQLISLSAALLAAMAADSLVYGGLSGNLELSKSLAHLSGKLAGGLSVILPISLYISWQFRRSRDDLERGVLERGAFDVMTLRKQVKSAREALEQSKAEYDQVKNLFSRYVEKEVVEEILQDTTRVKLGGESRTVTVLFADIRGYSTLSEQLSAQQVIELLNEYFAAMSEIIHFERGTIIEFEGDAILVVFNAPLDQDDHAARSVRTALNMLRRINRLNRIWERNGTADKWKSVGIESFAVRIGIHSGPVVVGNIGSEARTKYAVIGDTVNLAHRVEALNKKLMTTMLLSDSTLDELHRTGDDALPLVDLGKHSVKGRAEEVRVFSLKDLVDEDTLAQVTPDREA